MSRLSLVIILLVLSSASLAAQVGTGSYRCASYNVSGGGGSCRTMPRLVLNADGTYQFSSTQGRWSAQNGKLYLSESSLWGAGEILGKDSVRFEYDYNGWHHTVTWNCQECSYSEASSPTSASTGTSSSGGGQRGVSLTLQFQQSIGGVSGFTIVPIESAGNYTHNAPLPNGAVQGLAWETSATSAALATNVYNKLKSGRQYIVFLAWPRETLPVALLDLPSGNSDYTATLPASLSYRIPPPSAGSTSTSSRSSQSKNSTVSKLEAFAQALQELGTALNSVDQQKKTSAPDKSTNTVSNVVAPRYQIGMEITAINEQIASNLGQPQLRGIGIVRVLENGRAKQAGLRAGDVLVTVNNVAIPNLEAYQNAIRHRENGEPSYFNVFREGKYLDIVVP